MTRTLYTLPLPTDAQTSTGQEHRRQLSKQGTVDGSDPVAEAVSTDPNEFTLEGQFRGRYADVMATEIEELFSAGDVREVPFFGDFDGPADGYYTLETVDVNPVHPGVDDLDQFNGRITYVGSRRSHWRALDCAPAPVENDFGSEETALVGVPATASKARWFDAVSKQREEATPIETHSAEHADVAVYDALDASFEDPTLIYDVPYDAEGPIDPMVWDDRGEGDREDGDGVPQWQDVFDTRHNYVGDPVLSNGLVRLFVDEDANDLTAEEWDDGADEWSAVALGTSDWELFDLDITRIGIERVEAQVEFWDPTASPTEYYSLDMLLRSGATEPQWIRPEDETSATPSGLQDLLDPVASAHAQSAQATQTVISRAEVRR